MPLGQARSRTIARVTEGSDGAAVSPSLSTGFSLQARTEASAGESHWVDCLGLGLLRIFCCRLSATDFLLRIFATDLLSRISATDFLQRIFCHWFSATGFLGQRGDGSQSKQGSGHGSAADGPAPASCLPQGNLTRALWAPQKSSLWQSPATEALQAAHEQVRGPWPA